VHEWPAFFVYLTRPVHLASAVYSNPHAQTTHSPAGPAHSESILRVSHRALTRPVPTTVLSRPHGSAKHALSSFKTTLVSTSARAALHVPFTALVLPRTACTMPKQWRLKGVFTSLTKRNLDHATSIHQ